MIWLQFNQGNEITWYEAPLDLMQTPKITL
jgi:hypothetical protein